MEPLVIQGKYQHYKGGLYKLLHEATKEETGEKMIVYRPVEKRDVWIRNKDNFFMNVMVNGEKIPRFKLLEDSV